MGHQQRPKAAHQLLLEPMGNLVDFAVTDQQLCQSLGLIIDLHSAVEPVQASPAANQHLHEPMGHLKPAAVAEAHTTNEHLNSPSATDSHLLEANLHSTDAASPHH